MYLYIQPLEVAMQIAKWGNSLAVRLPAELVRELGLREGDQIDMRGDKSRVTVRRSERPEEVLARLRKLRGRLSKENRLSRDDANAR